MIKSKLKKPEIIAQLPTQKHEKKTNYNLENKEDEIQKNEMKTKTQMTKTISMMNRQVITNEKNICKNK